MAELSSAKTLGGIGSILLILTLVPYVGIVLGIVGWVLILVAVKYISDIVHDGSIFNNALIAVILAIIGVVVFVVLVIGTLFSFVGLSSYNFGSTTPTTVPTDIIGLLVGLLVGLAALWIFGILSSVFLRMSFNKVARAINVKMFGTAALLYLIGAALTIIIVGFVLIFIAEILFIVAFFSIPDRLEAPPTMGYTPSPPMTPPS